MEVLLVAPQPFYQERGTPIATRLLAETLCGLGHRVDLLTYHEGQDIAAEGLEIFRIPRLWGIREIPIGFSWKKVACDVVLSLKLMGQVRKRSYDVIHAVEESVFPALLARRRGRRLLVYDMDSSLVEQLTEGRRWSRALRGPLRRLERMAIERADLVLAVCPDLGELAGTYGTGTTVRVVEDVPLQSGEASAAAGSSAPGVEDLRAGLGPRDSLALYVGNLESYQGVDLLLESLARLPRSDLRLVVIGGPDGAVAARRRQAEALGLADRVRFVGPRPLRDLGSYLAQADLLVSPRLRGGNTPMKIYSYLASGRPILATRIRAHTQVLDDGCAVLVEPEAAAMAAGLATLLEEPELRRALGRAARELAEARFSRARFTESVREAYGELEARAST